jgi:hypothetical protein
LIFTLLHYFTTFAIIYALETTSILSDCALLCISS